MLDSGMRLSLLFFAAVCCSLCLPGLYWPSMGPAMDQFQWWPASAVATIQTGRMHRAPAKTNCGASSASSQTDTTSPSTTSGARPTWSVTAAANRKAEEEIENRRRGKVKEYVPATLHPIALFGFAVLCLGLVAGLEVLLRSKLLVERGFGGGRGEGPLKRAVPVPVPVPVPPQPRS